MRMTRFEKLLVNRQRKGRRNAKTVESLLEKVDSSRIKDVLEIGCGIGVVSETLAESRDVRVVGTDVDPEQVELARKLYQQNDRVRFLVEDAAHLTFPDHSFDLAVSQMVLHHVSGWREVVREVARVLRPGGVYLWQDLALPGWLKKLPEPFIRPLGLYTFEDMLNEFEAVGLRQLFHEEKRSAPFFFLLHYVILEKRSSTQQAA